MNVQELIRQTPFEEVWQQFAEQGHIPVINAELLEEEAVDEETFLKALKAAYEDTYCKMAALEGVESAEGEYLVVVEGYHPTYVDDLIYPEFDVFSVRKGGHDKWALDLCPWRETLGLEAYQGSIDLFGAPFFLAEVLAEMTWWGMEPEDVDDEIAELKARIDEAENADESSFVNYDEMCEELGIERPSAAEIEEQLRLEDLEEPLREEYRRRLEDFLAGTGWGGYRRPKEERGC